MGSTTATTSTWHKDRQAALSTSDVSFCVRFQLNLATQPSDIHDVWKYWSIKSWSSAKSFSVRLPEPAEWEVLRLLTHSKTQSLSNEDDVVDKGRYLSNSHFPYKLIAVICECTLHFHSLDWRGFIEGFSLATQITAYQISWLGLNWLCCWSLKSLAHTGENMSQSFACNCINKPGVDVKALA